MKRSLCTALAGFLFICALSAPAYARQAAKTNQALAAAVAAKSTVRVRALLLGGANPNAPQPYRVSLLMVAAGNEDTADTILLLTHGADVAARDTEGETALHHAALYNLSSYDRGDFVSQGDVSKRCAVLGVLRLLVIHRANVNAADKAGETPLMLTAGYAQSPGCVQLLLSAGAGIEAKDKNGWTALDYAQREAGDGNNAEVVALLKSAQEKRRKE